MMQELPLGGFDLDLNSKQSRAEAVNMYVEAGDNYFSAQRADGMVVFVDTGEEYCRSDILFVDNFLFFVAGNDLYRVDKLGNKTSLGTVGGAGRCAIAANSIPDDQQVIVLNGLGQAYVYQPSVGLTLVTDGDYKASSSVTTLNERFFLTRDGTSEFFASAVSDGTDYPTAAFANAEEAPDDVIAVIAQKSALYVLGQYTTEYWQIVNDDTLPVRKVQGATFQRGCAAVHSVQETGESFCFLANDKTVRMISGTQMQKISNLAFEIEIKGDGSTRNPGYSKIDDAFAFYVDGPIHKLYYITFPTEGVTWGYDLATGLWHKRESTGQGYWRAIGAVNAFERVIVADAFTGKLYYLDPDARDEAGTRISCRIRTPSTSWRKNVTVPLIEADMESGVGLNTGQGSDPEMMVRFSKDGGRTWLNHSRINLGKIGHYQTRVPMRRFGRVVRNKDFALEFEVTDPVDFRMYRLFAEVNEGM